jgi:hypothetical protein
MAYQVRRPGNSAAVLPARSFYEACRVLCRNADALGGGDFEIWRVEKRGRHVTEEREALFTYGD